MRASVSVPIATDSSVVFSAFFPTRPSDARPFVTSFVTELLSPTEALTWTSGHFSRKEESRAGR